MAVDWYTNYGSTATIFREGNMKQEIWITMGQEWRDLALMLFGMGLGIGIGVIVMIERQGRKPK